MQPAACRCWLTALCWQLWGPALLSAQPVTPAADLHLQDAMHACVVSAGRCEILHCIAGQCEG